MTPATAACLHCHTRLKGNDVVEAFPFGARVAFDPARQRFWVVCHKCGKWSMAPLEDDERFGAIEVLERWWRESSRHYTAAGIGVGQHSETFSIVRIGEATWPEFASWRYAEAIQRRNSTRAIRFAWGSAVMVASVAAGWMHPVPAIALATFLPTAEHLWPQFWLNSRNAICRVPAASGARELVRSKHLSQMELERSGRGWVLNTTHDTGTATLAGDEGTRVLSYALGRINNLGASKRIVAEALKLVEETGGTDAMVEKAARVAPGKGSANTAMVLRYPVHVRIALELATRELMERHELENEIAILKHEWREAEEIAGISDGLLR